MARSTLVDFIQEFPERGEKRALIHQTAFRTFTWSYAHLYRDIQKTASFLGSLGVERGDKILIWAPNSPEWALVYLACLYRGAVAVPADAGASLDFIEAIAQETQARLIFHSRIRDIAGLETPAQLIEDLIEDIEGCTPAEQPAQVGEDDLAQILYTSGTTGTPKGVLLTHGNIAANLRSIEQSISIDAEHLLVSILPLSHVFEQSVTFWSSLIHGATIIFLQILKPSELFKAFSRYPVTALTVVPEFLDIMRGRVESSIEDVLGQRVTERLLDAAGHMLWRVRYFLFFPVHSQIGTGFRFFIVGGAPLDPELEAFWMRLGFLVLQGYGLTEAAPVLTANRPDMWRPGSAGLPVPGVEVKIAEDDEVLGRGANISPGYFEKPEQTRETFENGWLHTGDLGYFDEEGFLFLKGRKKDMIVTPAGLNVYSQDVEGAFDNVSGVRDAAVLEFKEHVHATLLLEPGADPDAVVEQANSRLAEHQRVEGYTVWPDEDFPRTTTRKPKKHEILDGLERMEQEAEPQPDRRTEEEGAPDDIIRTIARVADKPASAVKPEAQLGSDLGLGSVERIELVMALEEELRTEIAEQDITDETTVQDIRQLLEEGDQGQRLEFARWGLWRPVVGIRSLFQKLALFPAYDWLVQQRVEGLEHILDLEPPVIFAPNHTSHLDTAGLLRALPPRFRRRLATAIFAEFFEAPRYRLDKRLWKKFEFLALTLGFNIYPLPRTHGFRQSLAYTGELLDQGWNILVYPEGRLTDTGDINPFREGIGIMAREMRVPVVPVHIAGLREVLPRDRYIPHQGGSAVIRFGRPLTSHKESYEEFTRRLEQAVRALGQGSSEYRAIEKESVLNR